MKILNNAPWWLVSAGLHAVLLLGAALIYVERLMAIDSPPTVVTITSPLPPPVPPPEAPAVDAPQPGIKDDPDPAASIERVIFNPSAEIGKKNQSADNDPREQMLGQSRDGNSYLFGDADGRVGHQPGKNPGFVANIGIGPGGGGARRYGDRFGGMKDERIRDNGGSDRTEKGVFAALRWLARHQNGDGSWSASGFSHACLDGRCSGTGESDYDTGVTSLSLLAFLGAGYTPMSKHDKHMDDPDYSGPDLQFGETVKRGLQWLVAHQDPEGCVGERGMKYMYNHAVAALALSEAWGMWPAPIVHDPAQKAIDFLVASQNPGKGWRYSAKCGDNDTSVTGWAVMALKSAELSELAFPPAVYAGALAWLGEATDQSGYYRVGYNARDTGKVYVPGKNELFADHPSMSAVAVMARIFMEKKRQPALTAVNFLAADLPAWKPGQVDFYYWYYASLALFQYDGPTGAFWKKWNEPMKAALLPNQKTSGCERGSWDPSADRWGFEGGRVYASAINALTLEVYYRYANVFGGASRK
jgi:hypothetical protein